MPNKKGKHNMNYPNENTKLAIDALSLLTKGSIQESNEYKLSKLQSKKGVGVFYSENEKFSSKFQTQINEVSRFKDRAIHLTAYNDSVEFNRGVVLADRTSEQRNT